MTTFTTIHTNHPILSIFYHKKRHNTMSLINIINYNLYFMHVYITSNPKTIDI